MPFKVIEISKMLSLTIKLTRITTISDNNLKIKNLIIKGGVIMDSNKYLQATSYKSIVLIIIGLPLLLNRNLRLLVEVLIKVTLGHPHLNLQ